MRVLSYIPGKSTLVLLFKAARVRLMSNGARVDSLSDARIESATEEMNQISDDIRDAKVIGPIDRVHTPHPANVRPQNGP